MSLQELQKWVDASWKERPAIDRPNEQQQLLFVIEEFGELAEAIRKIKGNKEYKQVDVDLGSEFADLLISLTTLANTYDIDLTAEVESFKVKITKRRQDQLLRKQA
jgi:NTP pyrophosphatase (non-canonical NTP hydrolase)